MNRPSPAPLPGALRAEARNLFVLAEAAAEAGIFAAGGLETTWLTVARRCTEGKPLEEAAVELHTLLRAALRPGTAGPAWITERWRALEGRLRQGP